MGNLVRGVIMIGDTPWPLESQYRLAKDNVKEISSLEDRMTIAINELHSAEYEDVYECTKQIYLRNVQIWDMKHF